MCVRFSPLENGEERSDEPFQAERSLKSILSPLFFAYSFFDQKKSSLFLFFRLTFIGRFRLK